MPSPSPTSTKRRAKSIHVWRGSAGKASAALLAVAGVASFGDIILLPLTLVCLLCAAVGFAVALRRRVTVVLGEDGLQWTAGGATVFVPYSDIADVRVELRKDHARLPSHLEHALHVALRGDDARGLTVSGPKATLTRLSRTIQAARTSHAALEGPETSAVARSGRSLVGWLRELGAIGAGARAQYRQPPPHPEQLWRIIEAPIVPPSQRAAAAIALGPLDRSDRRRLGRIAKANASRNLRFALGQIASGVATESALAASLGELDGHATADGTGGRRASGDAV
jgi:hypothetical protein